MPFASSVLNDLSLVPSARFGAALHRERSNSGATMAALARASDGAFLPDDLVAIERGETALDDPQIRVLCDLYELSDRPWAPASSLELVLDRAPMSDFESPSTALAATSRDEVLPWIASRFVALSVILGLDVTSGPLGLDVVAEALELPFAATVELIALVLETEAARIGTMIASMEERVAVPEVGFLVAETEMGSLLMTGRGPVADSARIVSPCGSLGGLVRAGR